MPKGLILLIRKYDDYVRHQGIVSLFVFPGAIKKDKELKAISIGLLDSVFRTEWEALFGDNRNFKPNPYSLRHAYCVHTIDRWVAENREINSLLPFLSSQLGHSTLDDTLYYYHQINASSQAIRTYLERDNHISKEFLNDS